MEVCGTFDLGWRFDDALPADARAGIDSFMPLPEVLKSFSFARRVELPRFWIATTTFVAQDLLADLDDDDDDYLLSLEDCCDQIDDLLRPHGLRLPSEDEIEAACGGGLFAWGDEVPQGEPREGKTTFKGHLTTNERGLELNSNPYRVEISRCAFKLGDGGEAICGGYPWPVPWLSFSPSYRRCGESVEDLLFEYLEEAQIRPVRR